MKIISVMQPWATLLAVGIKTNETRSWYTSHRGPTGIHASKGFPKWAREACRESPFREALAEHGCTEGNLPLGKIICVSTLESCIRTEHVNFSDCHSFEKAFGDFYLGRFAWGFGKDRRLLTPPIEAKGSLGLWEFDDAKLAELVPSGTER